MRTLIAVALICGLFFNCGPTHRVVVPSEETNSTEQDTVRISNDEIEYEIIIIEPGFNVWLQTIAKPEGFYSQSYLESRNRVWVAEWNNRVLQPYSYNPNLYEMHIDYNPAIDYGYEVNYKLFNYLVYFQIQYKQRLGGFVPRI